MAADIFCTICGARPFPELTLPTIVRADHDLRKLKRESKGGDTWWAPADVDEGQWFCSAHWRRGPRRPDGSWTYVVVEP
jgi:hypothetical protein